MKYISAEGRKKLKKELEERRTIKRQEIAQRLEHAKDLGDLSENAEYAAAKEAQAFNEGRILELEEIVKEAALIRPSRKGQKEVQLGSVVEVKDLFAKRQTFTIVGSQEAEPGQGKISNESPLGQAFFGHQVGDIIEVETPKKKVKYKIVRIK
ncbi:MAG: transcription elongation factor GreA [Candidatus Portnoybacteria bacterium]|nr:transcription elongation factor GreA [Candidatus Portnoybacteria bacterium]